MTTRELDVLDILWKSAKPMIATNIVEQKKYLTQSTVNAVLRKLLNNNLVEVAGVTHSGRVLGRTYRPTEASRDIILQNFLDGYNNFCDIISEATLCVNILTKDKTPAKTKEEIKKLMKLLDEWEKKNHN